MRKKVLPTFIRLWHFALSSIGSFVRRLPKRYIVLAIGALLLFMISANGLRALAPLELAIPQNRVPLDGPLTVRLNRFIGEIDTSNIKITPTVAGKWQHVHTGLFKGDQLVFTPSHYFIEDRTYTVEFPEVTRAIGTHVMLPGFRFITEKAPVLKNTTGIGSWKNGQVIAADTVLTAELASANHGTRELELRTTPAIAADAKIEKDRLYTWKPVDLLPQDTDISVEVYDTKNAISLHAATVHTAPQPTLVTPTEQWNIDANDTITLSFSQPIDPISAQIQFDVAGSGSWRDASTYVFTPHTLSPNSTYSYTIASGLRSTSGGILLSAITGTFSTIGAISVIATSPHGAELPQGQQTISFTFSRPVDHASAEQRLSISSGTVTGTSWNGNTFSATVANLGYQQTFSATIAAGVINTSFGVPSNRPYSLGFTTEVRSVRLNVPFYRQQYNASCTAASLRMILGWRGIGADDISIVQQMGYNPRPRDNSTNPPTWDDPQTMFVGDINGTIQGGTGAGPDAPPVASAARAYGLNASAVNGIGPGWIAEQLYAGRPVIMFGAYRATGMTTWQTPGGGSAVMNLSGHTTVVIGVKGEPSAPIGFWVSDPLGGTSFWSTGTVAANIARDPYRQAVVAY